MRKIERGREGGIKHIFLDLMPGLTSAVMCMSRVAATGAMAWERQKST